MGMCGRNTQIARTETDGRLTYNYRALSV